MEETMIQIEKQTIKLPYLRQFCCQICYKWFYHTAALCLVKSLKLKREISVTRKLKLKINSVEIKELSKFY